MRLSVFVTMFVLTPFRLFAGCDPLPEQVAFFQDVRFGGKCVVRGLGSYPTSAKLGMANDSISSIKVGSAVQVLVCRDAGYEGRCELFRRSDDRLGDNAIGNDTISSAKVQLRGTSLNCEPRADQVAFFHDAGFGGPCEVHSIGEYRNSEEIGLSNDSISSVEVGSGAQVLLCKDANLSGDCELLTASDPNLGDNRIGNDSVSSMLVQALGTDTCRVSDDSVVVFQHAGFTPPCAVLGPGNYRHSEAIGLPNDSMSSIRIGRNAQALLCRDADFEGDCQLFVASEIAHLDDTRIGNDNVSSMKVQRAGFDPCPIHVGQVAFYEHGSFTEPCTVRVVGDYPNAATIGLPNRSISSVRLGGSVKVCAWDSDSFKGRFLEIDSSSAHLDGFNDSIASAVVIGRSTSCPDTSPSPATFRAIEITNCDPNTIHIWMRDIFATEWTEAGTMAAFSSSGECPQKEFALENGKTSEIVVVDPTNGLCDNKNDPAIVDCRKASGIVLAGSFSGSTYSVRVDP